MHIYEELLSFGFTEKELGRVLITDSRANELGIAPPSIDAVKGDALMDFIVMKNCDRFNETKSTAEELHDLKENYCGNTNFTSLMKEFNLYEKINFGSNVSALTDSTAATSFEALIWMLYERKGVESVEMFLDIINFYSGYNRFYEDKDYTNLSIREVVTNSIISISDINFNELDNSASDFMKMYKNFEDCLKLVAKENSGDGFNDIGEIVDYVSSVYQIQKVGSLTHKKYVQKSRYLLKKIYQVIIDIKELDANNKEEKVFESKILLNLSKMRKYREKYVLSYLKILENKLS